MSSDSAGQEARRGLKLSPRFWAALILLVLAGIFVAQNRDRHPVHVLWVTVESPTWFVLTVIFLVGWLVGALLRWRRRR